VTVSYSTPTSKAKASPASSMTTASPAVVAVGATHQEMVESQVSATEIGVTKFMSQLDCLHI
jgi:hypothetical protein